MMKHLVNLLFCIVLVGCSVSPEPKSVIDDAPQEQAQSNTQLIPTSTESPTDTPEPSPTSEPNLAPTSSPTPFPVVNVEKFILPVCNELPAGSWVFRVPAGTSVDDIQTEKSGCYSIAADFAGLYALTPKDKGNVALLNHLGDAVENGVLMRAADVYLKRDANISKLGITATSTRTPISILEWPFDTNVPIASVNYFDHDKLSFDTHIEDWIDNNHLVTYNCIEVQWPDHNLDRYMAFYRDRSTNNEVLFSDKHGGLDLNFPVGTPLISKWETEIFTEGDFNVVFLLNNGELTLKLGHIDYFSAGFERGKHYLVKPGDVVGYVKDGNGYTITHSNTGPQKYTEIHFEIALLKSGKQLIKGNYNGGTHYVVDGLLGECNPDPYVHWITGLDELTWVNDISPDFSMLVYKQGTPPIKFEIMSEEEIREWIIGKNE